MYKNIYNIENLYRASYNAMKGKKSKNSAARFWVNEDKEILKMQRELQEKTYNFGGYNSFILHDNGVIRRISVAPYERKKGIPLGNLTSQFFGNLYLNQFDHFAKECLRVKGYIRYVDDMLFFSNSKAFLENIVKSIQEYLVLFRLKIHPLKVKLSTTEAGFIFLGHKVFKTHFRLTSKAIRRGRKKLKKVVYDYRYERVNTTQAKNAIFGTVGFFKIGNNAKMIDELLAQTVLRKKPYVEVVPSGRFVEQQC